MTLRDEAIAAYNAAVEAKRERSRAREEEALKRRRIAWEEHAKTAVSRQPWLTKVAREVRYDFEQQCIWADDIPLTAIEMRHAGWVLVLLTECANKCGTVWHDGEVYEPLASLTDLGGQLARRFTDRYCRDCQMQDEEDEAWHSTAN